MTHCHHELWHIATGEKMALKMRIQTPGGSVFSWLGNRPTASGLALAQCQAWTELRYLLNEVAVAIKILGEQPSSDSRSRSPYPGGNPALLVDLQPIPPDAVLRRLAQSSHQPVFMSCLPLQSPALPTSVSVRAEMTCVTASVPHLRK